MKLAIIVSSENWPFLLGILVLKQSLWSSTDEPFRFLSTTRREKYFKTAYLFNDDFIFKWLLILLYTDNWQLHIWMIIYISYKKRKKVTTSDYVSNKKSLSLLIFTLSYSLYYIMIFFYAQLWHFRIHTLPKQFI